MWPKASAIGEASLSMLATEALIWPKPLSEQVKALFKSFSKAALTRPIPVTAICETRSNPPASSAIFFIWADTRGRTSLDSNLPFFISASSCWVFTPKASANICSAPGKRSPNCPRSSSACTRPLEAICVNAVMMPLSCSASSPLIRPNTAAFL